MGKCKHLIDISPYDPLCDHPCRLYGGGAVEAECETCQYRIENLERENAKLRDELDLCLKQVKKCEECEAMFNCEDCEAMLDCDECLRADASQKERKRLDYEVAQLRELVREMAAEIRGLGIDFARVGWCDYADRMRELGVEV